MGLEHRFDGDVMYATASDPMTLADIREHLVQERAEGGLACLELIDARAVTTVMSTAEVRSLVALLRGWSHEQPLGPTAIVVSTDGAFGMVRMLDMLVEDFCEVRAFRDLTAAETWLFESRSGNTQTEV